MVAASGRGRTPKLLGGHGWHSLASGVAEDSPHRQLHRVEENRAWGVVGLSWCNSGGGGGDGSAGGG